MNYDKNMYDKNMNYDKNKNYNKNKNYDKKRGTMYLSCSRKSSLTALWQSMYWSTVCTMAIRCFRISFTAHTGQKPLANET